MHSIGEKLGTDPKVDEFYNLHLKLFVQQDIDIFESLSLVKLFPLQQIYLDCIEGNMSTIEKFLSTSFPSSVNCFKFRWNYCKTSIQIDSGLPMLLN